MGTDEVFALDVVVLAKQLQELEGSSISSDAGHRVDFLVCCLRLKHVLPVHIPGGKFIEVVVVDGGDGEALIIVISWGLRLFNIFEDELAQLENKGLYVAHHSVLVVCANLLNHVFLGVGVSTEKIGDTTEQDRVCELNIVPDVFLQQLSDKFAQLAGFELVLDVGKIVPTGHPIFSLPLINGLAFSRNFIVLLHDAGDQVEEELLLLHREGLRVA